MKAYRIYQPGRDEFVVVRADSYSLNSANGGPLRAEFFVDHVRVATVAGNFMIVDPA